MNEELNADEKKLCKNCSHQRSHHKYVINEQNNDLKCDISECKCIHFVEWM